MHGSERMAAKTGPDLPGKRHGPGLSARLLVLTILFVMLAEVLIYVPSIANFRRNWLNDRIAAAQTAALSLEAAPAGMVPPGLERRLLEQVGAATVAVRSGGARRLLAISDMPPMVSQEVDLRDASPWELIMGAFGTLVSPDPGYMRVVGSGMGGAEFVEIVLDERPLREAMLVFSRNVLALSLVISGITAILVYAALHRIIVRPVRRLTSSIVGFAEDPEDLTRMIRPSGRRDEIGLAEEALASMQERLADDLRERKHLAALGLAVSKINHDLRNMLASAQLFSDRISTIADPTVQRFAPKLIGALDRAIAFCASTLAYGRAVERPPERRQVALRPLVDEIEDMLGLSNDAAVAFVVEVSEDLSIDADPDQLSRVLVNLSRNAVQALGSVEAPVEPPRVTVSARRSTTGVVVTVADNGPGVPAKARERLFEAFQGSTRAGGTGLGLAIAAELVRAHGGRIELLDTPSGAVFRFDIPDRGSALR
jgi:signal transduction histidine kinase